MSEAILYALDAPRVKDADAAARFVDKWQDSKDAPTPGIAAFFERLLQTWPTDSSQGAVWYEDFEHNTPAGSLLAMTFELSQINADRLQQLRAIASQHGLHVFDPQGHVLYLANGVEASGAPMAVPAPDAAQQCKSGVRFDGVYETKGEESWRYLCFTADGQIFWQSTKGRYSARAAIESLIACDSFVAKGKYKPGANSFSARTKAAYGSFKLSGVIKDDGLHVHSERSNGDYPNDAVYTFLPI